MPLHADYPVLMRLVLDCFDHTVGSDRGDAQTVTQIADGLVMRSIDLEGESAVFIRVTRNRCELSDFAAGLDPRGMDGIGRIRREAFLAVFDGGVQLAGNVLVESAAQTDVQALATIANGEYWFPGGEGVLEDCKISFLPVRVGVMRLFVTQGAIERRIHVRRPSGKNEGVQVLNLCGKIICRKLEGQRNGFTLSGGEGGERILEPSRIPFGLFLIGAPWEPPRGPRHEAPLAHSRGHLP